MKFFTEAFLDKQVNQGERHLLLLLLPLLLLLCVGVNLVFTLADACLGRQSCASLDGRGPAVICHGPL